VDAAVHAREPASQLIDILPLYCTFAEVTPATSQYRDLGLLREAYSLLQVWKGDDYHA
jgi:hypothetical protein